MEQLNRAKRYLKRIQKLYAGVFSSMGHDEEEYFDDVLSFFIHCYHVRDWAFHQDGAVVRAREIDAFIDLNEPLRICADLANGSKHYKLMRTPRSGHQPTISQPQKLCSTWFVGDGVGEILQCSYRVESNGKSFDVRELACECITLWEKFLNGPRSMD